MLIVERSMDDRWLSNAFVVGDDNSRRVLLLATAYQRYRQLVERMAQGAVTVTGPFANCAVSISTVATV